MSLAAHYSTDCPAVESLLSSSPSLAFVARLVDCLDGSDCYGTRKIQIISCGIGARRPSPPLALVSRNLSARDAHRERDHSQRLALLVELLRFRNVPIFYTVHDAFLCLGKGPRGSKVVARRDLLGLNHRIIEGRVRVQAGKQAR
jgi:hypothetical protein